MAGGGRVYTLGIRLDLAEPSDATGSPSLGLGRAPVCPRRERSAPPAPLPDPHECNQLLGRKKKKKKGKILANPVTPAIGLHPPPHLKPITRAH